MRRLTTTATGMSRRRFLRLGAAGSAALLSACASVSSGISGALRGPGDGRLTARPAPVPRLELEPWLAAGTQEIPVASGRRVLLALPPGFDPNRETPLAVGFLGAVVRAEAGLRVFGSGAGRRGVIEVSPQAAHGAWDVMLGGFGEDLALVDAAMRWVFARFAIDPLHLASVGFSNGASYALSVGLTNGDVFSHIVAFSPGFMAPGERHGRPPIFIAHGTEDRVLPIDKTSRRFVPELRSGGYDVTFRTFEGRHEVVPALSTRALDWFLRR